MELKRYKLGDICYINKASLKSTDKVDDILYLDTSNITENAIAELQSFQRKNAPSRAQRKVGNKTIIFSTVRPNQNHFGIMNNPQTNLIVSSGFTTLDIKDAKEFDANYVYLKLTQPAIVDYLQTLAQNSVSSYPSINPDDIANLSFSFPPLPTQQKIAAVLSALDDKIALNRRISAKLEAMAKLLYDYWFVQFDFLDENGKPYRSSGGKMVWNDELKREIPDGWEVGNLYDIADFFNGLACQKYRPTDENHKLPVIKIDQMHNGFDSDVEWARDNVPTKNIIENGDILFSWSATLETMLWTKGKGVLNQHIFKVVPKNIDKYFVFQHLSAYIVNFVRMAEARKTTMGHITTDHLNQSRIVIPSKEIAEMYGSIVSAIYEKYLICAEENQHFASLRDFLLPLLMNGQVKVTDNLQQDENIISFKDSYEQRFNYWLENQCLAARGTVSEKTLRAIFDAMDDDDK